MSVADDYFARVRPLLATGLTDKAIAVDDPDLALLVIELLASCMLERVTTSPAVDEFVAWKQPFAPLRAPTGADARIVARRGPSSIAWSRGTVYMSVDPSDVLAYVDVSYHVARTLRDILLGRIDWPDRIRGQPFDPRGIAIDLRGKHICVIGCGSLGSEAVRMLANSGARFTLVDDAKVTVYNLARQWFGVADVGRAKVDALADRLPGARAVCMQLDSVDALEGDRPDLVILATGTHHHASLAEGLWRLGIPHVAACCYPQARYFEVSVVAPPSTPCLHCFRGHLYRGTPEHPPMTDEVAAFLYQPNVDRVRAYTDLVAEPASRIETLRAAHVLARAAVELLVPQSPWFQRVLAESTTCLLGGNVAGAYGITDPGQVLRLGTGDIAGSTDHVICHVCARTLEVNLRDELPAIPDDADAALLAR